VIDETHDARSFVLDVPSELRAAFSYRAGQFLTFAVPWEQNVLSRCYSLSSSPECDRSHQVTVKRVSGGRASNWLNDHAKVGATLDVLPPAGRFVLKNGQHAAESGSAPAPGIVLFAAGSGITPVFSLIKSALAQTSRKLKLVYANRDERSSIFRRELDELARLNRDRFELLHNFDDRDGFLTGERVARELANWSGSDFYVCGPGPFMDLVEGVLRQESVPRDRIFIERFVSAPDLGSVSPENGATRSGTFRARWQGRLHEVRYEAGETLLQAARRAGVDPPFSCEEGYCSSCQAKLLCGRVDMSHHECLTEDEVAQGAVLPCQARAASAELEIDWD
jgi:3-ketosteroid 9alpha-monooxygenase subunit B